MMNPPIEQQLLDGIEQRNDVSCRQAKRIEALEAAGHALLDAMNEADHARGYDEKQDAMWSCGTMREALQQLLAEEP